MSVEPAAVGGEHSGFAGRLAATFVNSRLTAIALGASILLGIASVLMLPREEEPQIQVPMIDVFVRMPGASATEVEQRVSRPMESLIWEIPGVEYVYSISHPGESLVIVRFEVGHNLEESLIRLNQKLETNFDRIPHGVSDPLVKPRTIDDVPILALTFHSATLDHYTIRRVVREVETAVKRVPAVAETLVIGGPPRVVRVMLDPLRLASRGLVAEDVAGALQAANRSNRAGAQVFANREILLEVGQFLTGAREVGDVVVGVYGGKPIYLREVARVDDGPAEPENYVFMRSRAGDDATGGEEPAVTLTIAKRPGANAVSVVDEVMEVVERQRGLVIPPEITVTVTRDYGETAAEKSNELLLHMGIAVFGVALLILVFLGWRESLVVLLAVPATLSLTLLIFYLHGYTLNRITLFALIFSIGILVDDAIVVVENIQRHKQLPRNRRRPLAEVAVEAVDEVGNPTILATWAVIAAILPMAFVGGLMGPYMRPIPVGASAAMVFSLLVAFSITPWAAVRLLRGHGGPAAEAAVAGEDEGSGEAETPDDWFTRIYHRAMDPLLGSVGVRWSFLVGIFVLLLAALALVPLGRVKVKMLPFDNKSEFQVILDMPEGTTLEQTTRVAREIADAVEAEPEVADTIVYAGTASPFNFNGLVRHYFLREGSHVADVQVNLLPKHDRAAQSHDVARRVRPAVASIAARYGGVVAVAEVPPGPPVLQTIVAEVFAPDDAARERLARDIRRIFESTPGVVDIDWTLAERQETVEFVIDEGKAALSGISEESVARTVALAVSGLSVDLLHQPHEREDVNVVLEVPRELRTRPEDLLALRVRGQTDSGMSLVPLRELVEMENVAGDRSRYRKNLTPVIYVTADVAGEAESPAYAILAMNRKLAELDARDYGGTGASLQIWNARQPDNDHEPAIKWDGEWHITLEVFRDLGLAFIAVLVLIYMLMVGWFRDYVTPLVVMAAIPFSLIGILPAHWGMDAFFTATSMIGFMAGAGIVVRNSIILVDFVELRMRQGQPLAEAVVEAGAVRFRPMLLTALAVIVGASVILADPIFQGLAISLMFGEIASLLISRMAVPVLYFMVNRRRDRKDADSAAP